MERSIRKSSLSFVCLLPVWLVAYSASAQSLRTEGNIETDAQLVSHVPTGAPPLEVSSTTRVPALNADRVDGLEGADLALKADLVNVEAMLAAVQAQVDALGPARVQQTGQTTCYEALGGALVECGTGAGLAQDGDLQLGVAWPNPRFTQNGDATVTDNLTGLIWLEDVDCFGTRSWTDALAAANGLFDGATNDPGGGDCGLAVNSVPGAWRLPNLGELQSLVHYGMSDPALPNTAGTAQWAEGDPFSGVESEPYWSSTTFSFLASLAWIVEMQLGFDGTSGKANLERVWPVRDGQ